MEYHPLNITLYTPTTRLLKGCYYPLITHRQSWGKVFAGVCLSVFLQNVSKTRITKHHKCSRRILETHLLGVKGHKNSAGMHHCTLVSAGFFQ